MNRYDAENEAKNRKSWKHAPQHTYIHTPWSTGPNNHFECDSWRERARATLLVVISIIVVVGLKFHQFYEALESKFRTYDYSTTNTVAASALAQYIYIYVNIGWREKRMITGTGERERKGNNQNWLFMFGCCDVKREIQNKNRNKKYEYVSDSIHDPLVKQTHLCPAHTWSQKKTKFKSPSSYLVVDASA